MLSLSVDVLEKYMDKTSNPGLCCCLCDALRDEMQSELIDFGRRAQKEILTKEAAYALAGRTGIHLSEHGGTGLGVIGALAGVGLRMSGNDGRYRGRIKIHATRNDGRVSVAEICAQSGAAEVRDMNGAALDGGQLIYLNKYAKAVLVDKKKVVMVSLQEDGSYITCTKEELENLKEG